MGHMAPDKRKEVGFETLEKEIEIQNAVLATALQKTVGHRHFSQKELDEFNLGELSYENYIKVGDRYFKPERKCGPKRADKDWIDTTGLMKREEETATAAAETTILAAKALAAEDQRQREGDEQKQADMKKADASRKREEAETSRIAQREKAKAYERSHEKPTNIVSSTLIRLRLRRVRARWKKRKLIRVPLWRLLQRGHLRW